MMATTDSTKEDPIYKEISKRFHENPDEFADALQSMVQASAQRYGAYYKLYWT